MNHATLGGERWEGTRSGHVRGGPVRVDTVTVALVLAIVLLGLVMVTSASMSIASRDGGDAFLYLERQLTLTLIGVGCAALMFCLPAAWLARAAVPLLVLSVLLLIAVLVPGLGYEVNGSRRWLRIADISFQPSELARVLTLVYIAGYAARREAELAGTFLGLAKPVAILAGIAVLLLAEPDFGAAMVLFATGFGVLFLADARLRYVLATTVFAAAAFGALAVSSGYRLRRLMTFLDPWADPYDSGFQLTQSLIAIGRGKWFGVGLGESVQKLFYLPEAHTDFLFAVLAEELGLAGVVATLALFLVLALRSLHIARLAAEAGQRFSAFLAAGFALWLGIQSFVNIGVNMGVLPTKGLTLPLMSYGRSSLVVTLAWIGVVLRVYHEARLEERGHATARTAGAWFREARA